MTARRGDTTLSGSKDAFSTSARLMVETIVNLLSCFARITRFAPKPCTIAST